jgi:prepilin-type N-terminal cleavage/methylation domain-containing protein
MKTINEHKGFTLIELLISMAILGIVLAGLASLFASQNRHHAAQNEILQMQGNARAAMDFVTRTMRGLVRNTLNITGEGTNNSEITFNTDESDFGGTIVHHRFVIYNSASDGPNTLGYARGEPGGSLVNQPLALNITQFMVQRRDIKGNPTETNANTARIDITITAQTPNPLPDRGAKGTITLRSSVDVRN